MSTPNQFGGMELAVAERTLKAIEELSARWHRAQKEYAKAPHEFNAGRMTGYAQAIQLLLGVPTLENVTKALEEGTL